MNLKSNVGVEFGLKLEKHVQRREKGQKAAVVVGIRIKKILSHVLCFTLNISDLRFTKFTIIVLTSAGRSGNKNTKLILAPPRGAGTKYCPIPTPPPLWGGENPHRVGLNCHPYLGAMRKLSKRERERERETKIEKHHHNRVPKNKEKRGHVCMKNA